jgi:hypothetical protein
MHPDSCWTVVALTGRSDPDRAARFRQALEHYRAAGLMGDLGEGPGHKPLRTIDIEDAIMGLLPSSRYDLILTHGLWGEGARHSRHEEVAKAVMALHESRRLSTGDIWMFAYDDDRGKHLPRPVESADTYIRLPRDIWERKYKIVTDVYGFAAESFEARTTPRDEAYWVIARRP